MFLGFDNHIGLVLLGLGFVKPVVVVLGTIFGGF